MNYLKNSIKNLFDFFANTIAYFRDVLLMHGFMLFILLPLLASTTRFILNKGKIDYLSYETIPLLFSKHPVVLLALFLVCFLILVAVFFEFTFLLLSIFFIKRKVPISLPTLLRGTVLQLKKIRFSTVLFFLFYFFLVLPLSGLGFNSDLLSKIKIPAFIMDFLFENRVLIIALVISVYLLLFYLAIRLIFALPEMILIDVPFKKAVIESWHTTKNNFFKIIGQFILIGGSTLILFSINSSIILLIQHFIEINLPNYALASAVVAMTLLQFVLLLNIIFSTVGIFYITIDFMDDHGGLPEIPKWFYTTTKKSTSEWNALKVITLSVIAIFFGIGVGAYNTEYLSHSTLTKPVTFSHRGVDDGNGVQNTIGSLTATSAEKPDYVEMDIQETKDKEFVVMHDFNLKKLTGVDKRPNELTLAELTKLTVRENGLEEPVCSFDDYLLKAKELKQKLLIEIKATKQDSPDMLDRFIKKYRSEILAQKHSIQTLTFDIAVKLKEKEPDFYVGYILPFTIVGTPVSNLDFYTMEYTTLNRNFINAAHNDGKKVYAWTINDETTITRMMFYGVDGIVTDKLTVLNKTIKTDLDELTYSDKLIHFVTGLG